MDSDDKPIDADDNSEIANGHLEDLWNIAISSNVDDSIPTKSSNEILTELFGAFNAEPPKSPVLTDDESDDESREKKHRKKRRKERRHKKRSRSKRHLTGEQDTSSVGYSTDSENDNERRKDRKHKKRKKSRHKNSEIGSDEERTHVKPPPCNDAPPTPLGTDAVESSNGNMEVNPCTSPRLPSAKAKPSEDNAVFEIVKPLDSTVEKCDKGKVVPGKIVIKDLKFSTVYEATVKEIEEQAKAKAEKLEEGEISDSSSSGKTSELSDEPSNEPSTKSEVEGPVETPSITEDQDKLLKRKRSPSKERSASILKKSRHRSRSRDHERRSKDQDKDRHSKHKDRDREKEKNKEKDKDKEKEKDRDKDKEKDRDKEKEKEKHRERGRDRDKDRKDRERDKKKGRSRSRSPRSRRRSSSRGRRRRSRDRRRSRSRSRDRKRSSGSDHIDKKKLLEIARRNAMNMLQAGILPPSIMGRQAPAPVPTAPVNKPDKNAAKTVDELTEYCKELSKRENLGELSSLSGSDDSESEKPFHHPFQVKDRPSFISLNIKNAVQLPLKTLQERTVEQSQLRIQFPVSSGQLHRKTESEWVPVTPQKKPEGSDKKTNTLKAIEAPKNEEPKSFVSGEVVDIGTLVSQRLSAMRKMHDDEQGHHTLSNKMQGWNNTLPGQFTGDTGARVLTPQQLASGAQAWARKVSVPEKILVT